MRRRSLTQNTWYQARCFNVDFDGNGLFHSFFSLVFERSIVNLVKNSSICKVIIFLDIGKFRENLGAVKPFFKLYISQRYV